MLCYLKEHCSKLHNKTRKAIPGAPQRLYGLLSSIMQINPKWVLMMKKQKNRDKAAKKSNNENEMKSNL